MFIHAGSRFERAEENGVAHFAEHMLFKGTERRTRQQLEREIENLGAQLEAFTTREMTAVYIKARRENINDAIDILGDIICNSSVSPLAVEEEKLTIIREMEAVGESIRGTIMDELHRAAFHKQPIGQPILGTHEKVMKLSASSIRSYLHTHFRADRMYVVAVGAVEHEKVLSRVENAFSNIPTSKPALKHAFDATNHTLCTESTVEVEKSDAKFVGSIAAVENPYTPFSHFAYAYETAGWTDPDHVVLHCYRFLLDSYVKGNSNARFSSNPYISTIAVRDLAESFTTFHARYSDTGLFGVYSVHGMDVTREGTRVSCENFLKHTSYCSQEDLEEAKRKLQLSTLSFLDGTTATCEDIGRQLIMTGRRMHPLEILQRIDEIDVAAIHRVGKRFFHRDPVLTLVGPTFDLPSYSWWKSRSFLHK